MNQLTLGQESAVKRAVRVIRGNAWNLMGPRNKKTRQEFVRLLTGEKKPLAQCGVVEIHKLLRALVQDPEGDIERQLLDWAGESTPDDPRIRFMAPVEL